MSQFYKTLTPSTTLFKTEGISTNPFKHDLFLHVPQIHCSGCISTIEKGLEKLDGIISSRVHYGLKRVMVTATQEITHDHLVLRLKDLGFTSEPLDMTVHNMQRINERSKNLLLRLAVSGFACMNVMLMSIAIWSGAEDTTRQLFYWLSALIALPSLAFSSQPFFINAFSSLKKLKLNMDVPISLAIFLSSVISLYEIILDGKHAYFDAALTLTFFLLCGRYLECLTRKKSQSAAQQLSKMLSHKALKYISGNVHLVNVFELKVGDRVKVSSGSIIPTDGIVINGESETDRSIISGENIPFSVRSGDKVYAGEFNINGSLDIKVTNSQDDTYLQRIVNQVSISEAERNKYTSLSDKAAEIYAPGVHILALSAFIFWILFTLDFRYSLNISIAVLIITCPCALGLAVPTVIASTSGKLFKKGILVKTSTALERLTEVDTIIFDKTGTLTTGKLKSINVSEIPKNILSLAASISSYSLHPLAKEITRVAKSKGVKFKTLDKVNELPGKGLEAFYEGKKLCLGKKDWVCPNEKSLANNSIATFFKIDNQKVWEFKFLEEIRDGVPQMLKKLQNLNLDTVVLSGDNVSSTNKLAKSIGIKKVRGGVSPNYKMRYIKYLNSRGHKVLMVGDGLNDTAALSRAHVSICPSTALDAAKASVDIIILNGKISLIPTLLKIAHTSKTRIIQNFLIAGIYNLIAVPIATLGFVTPLIAALAMSSSSIAVSLNALRK
jgi:Cu2+-exporting ATPase